MNEGIPVRIVSDDPSDSSANKVQLSGVCETLVIEISADKSIEVVDPLGVIDRFREITLSESPTDGDGIGLRKQAQAFRDAIKELGGSYLVGGEELSIEDLTSTTICMSAIHTLSKWCDNVGKSWAPALA